MLLKYADNQLRHKQRRFQIHTKNVIPSTIFAREETAYTMIDRIFCRCTGVSTTDQ